MKMTVSDILSQVEVIDGKIRSLMSGKEYEVDEFIEMTSQKCGLKRAEVDKLRAELTSFIRPQSKESIFIESIINKYDFKSSDGIYIVRGKIMQIDDIYRLLWKEERIIPTEVDRLIENIEKISEKIDLQVDIFLSIRERLKCPDTGKSKYLASLDRIYPNNNFRNILYNILVPNTKPIFHIFYDDGVGGTGKSTFLEVITKIVGEMFTSNVLLSQFSNRFVFANMLGKYVNIGDDDGKNDELQNVGTLKSIITGNRVTIDRKNISPIECRIFAKQLFATNILPYIDFTDGGIMRRLNIVQMNKVIPKTEKLCLLDDNEITRIVKEALSAGDVVEVQNELAITTSPVYRFFKEVKDTSYQAYQGFCYTYGFKPMNIINFEVKKRFIEHYINTKQTEREVNKDELPF